LNVLKKGIGKQDQYMAAYGGLTVLEVGTDGKVKVRSVELGSSSLAALVANTHIYYTGFRRNTLEVLTDQNEAMKSKETPNHQQVAESLHRIKDLGYRILDAIEREDFDAWGQMLDEHWQNKKRMSVKISFSLVDRLYDEVKADYGVLGGKIIGAGGGGFLMLYCPKNHKRLEQFMLSQDMPRLHYMVEPEGSKVVANVSSTKAMVFHHNGLSSEEKPTCR
jgi:D-glycero-alpha-D-manno-heptose-7-phosphate kinase